MVWALASLAALTVCASAARAQRLSPILSPSWAAKQQLDLELDSKKRARANARELLGFDRWHRFESARFEMELYQHDFTSSLAERPDRREIVEEIVYDTLVRLSQKSVQRRLRLTERRDEVRARIRGREVSDLKRSRATPGLDVSPRFRFGSDVSLGAKFSIDGIDSPFWSRVGLRLSHDVGGRDAIAKLDFRDDWRSFYLLYHADHKERGEMVELGIRISY